MNLWPTWFLPRAQRKILADAELIAQNLKRNRRYAQDLLQPAPLEQIKAWEARYQTLIPARDFTGLKALNKEVEKQGPRLFPPAPYEEWRENVEVFVVAGIMALAIRTFFLQPFQIPTGSMEPTLSGIEPTTLTGPAPNYLYQIYDFAIHGRTYSHVVTKQGGTIQALIPGHFTMWFEYTDVVLKNDFDQTETDRIWLRESDVESKLGVNGRHIYQPGEDLINVVIQTGDKVLVDKVTFNFRNPRVGDVIIFETDGIPRLDEQHNPEDGGGEVFIKRCLGGPGDTITLHPPYVLVNGQPASGASTFAQQFALKNDYPGYQFNTDPDLLHQPPPIDPITQTQTYPPVPADCFWAMGDNSPHSFDSRYFGPVPHKNFVGRGAFVFWPFTERWGFIP